MCLLWPETAYERMRRSEREGERETHTAAAAAAVRASDIGAENGCRVLQIHFESALRKSQLRKLHGTSDAFV